MRLLFLRSVGEKSATVSPGIISPIWVVSQVQFLAAVGLSSIFFADSTESPSQLLVTSAFLSYDLVPVFKVGKDAFKFLSGHMSLAVPSLLFLSLATVAKVLGF